MDNRSLGSLMPKPVARELISDVFGEIIDLPQTNIMESPIEVEGGIHLVGFEWNEKTLIQTLIMFCLFFLVASLIKVGYHKSTFLSTTFPESCILIMIGIAFGTVIKMTDNQRAPVFTVDLFFFGLLPPIILDSAYSLHDDNFYENLITILMYAVVGTLINVFLIGISLYVMVRSHWVKPYDVHLTELMTFATAISAVDPVCVIAIFQELDVNRSLYFLVFGESLLNDAVVVVLHRLMSTFVKAHIITAEHIITGALSFFLTSLGGLCIGLGFGFLTTIITLQTTDIRVVEPMIILGMAYLSFLTAEVFKWSGLISMIGCGIFQAAFAFKNVSRNSRTTTKYSVKTLSSIADLIIFFFLGTMLINTEPDFKVTFVISSLIFCMVYRVLSVFTLTYISNNYFHRTRIINFKEQALMAYGGLRGAVAFAMIAVLENDSEIKQHKLFRTTTLIIILFTVFILGGTTKPLMKLLGIQQESKQKGLLYMHANSKVITITLNAIEEISGNPSIIYYLKAHWNRFNNYMEQHLIVTKREDIVNIFEKIKMESQAEQLQGIDNGNEGNKSESHKKKKSHELSGDLQKISDKMDANPNNYDINIKLARYPLVIEKIERKRLVPKELSSHVIQAVEADEDSKRQTHSKIDVSTTAYLKTRFEHIHRHTKSESKESQTKHANNGKSSLESSESHHSKHSVNSTDFKQQNPNHTNNQTVGSNKQNETEVRKRQMSHKNQNGSKTDTHLNS